MQEVEREAAQLVQQFLAATPQQQAHAAATLVKFCIRQPDGIEWQDAGGRTGIVAAVVHAAKSINATLHVTYVSALGCLIFNHHENQTAAGAAGALPHLMQLADSNNADLQLHAVAAIGLLVFNHRDNQCATAAAGAMPRLMQLTTSSNDVLQYTAVVALGHVVFNHRDNQAAAAAAGAVPLLLHLSKSSIPALQGSAIHSIGCLVMNHRINQRAAGAAGAVEFMCNMMCFDNDHIAEAAAHTLNHISSFAFNARKAVSMGAVAQLLHLSARSGGHKLLNQALERLSAAPTPVPAPARTLAPGSRVRIDGCRGRPEMNGRTGVICGALHQASTLHSC